MYINGAGGFGGMVNIQGAGTSSSSWGIVVQDTGAANTFWTRDDGAGYLKASGWTYGSDRELKENIVPLAHGAETIKKLKTYKFDYINGPKSGLGFMADEVRVLLPELVEDIAQPGGGTSLGLRTTDLIPVLVNAINELSAELEALKARVK
jgi:hypothetical protein